MKLTGKTKEAFLKWLDTDRRMELHLPDVYLNALIIEFFDSVGVYIFTNRDFFFNDWYYKILGHFENSHFKSRTEATNEAIEKANTIYNESKL